MYLYFSCINCDFKNFETIDKKEISEKYLKQTVYKLTLLYKQYKCRNVEN